MEWRRLLRGSLLRGSPPGIVLVWGFVGIIRFCLGFRGLGLRVEGFCFGVSGNGSGFGFKGLGFSEGLVFRV